MADWWRAAVIYQVYLRSFQDGGSDGVGDLRGLTRRMEYLAQLGVDVVWISPFHPSPQRDFGYDVADYTAVDPVFGTLADVDTLLGRAHELGLRVLMDLVPNHTSEEHPWFADARSATTSAHRDWYLWRDPAPGGGAPSNWRAVTGESAWVLDAKSGQYYLASFLPVQPDLNWRNPDVRTAMYDVMRFWLDRGVDGFRVDMVDYLLKDERFRDEPPSSLDAHGRYEPATALYHLNQPDLLQLLRELREVVDSYPDRLLVGEVEYRLPAATLAAYAGDGNLLHLPINFWLLFLPFTAGALRAFVAEYHDALPRRAWPNWVLGSHDVSRVATRLGPDRARAAMLLLLTLRGTPFIYYGDELGLTDVPVAPEHVCDPWNAVRPGAGRDPARSPMPWDAGTNAGFTSPGATTWLPIGTSNIARSVAAQRDDPDSMLALTRRLLDLRRARPALTTGALHLLDHGEDGTEGVLAYIRQDEDSQLLVAVNTTGETKPLQTGEWRPGRTLVSTRSREASAPSEDLAPLEGRIVEVQPL
ncbi:MAG: DUF3459 domain-containing protein [Actinobacteria bacterium]|nr:DUF3459 domain-containing protein [Actinomycetota bacterium]